jgi:hypothetical protein
MQVNITKQKFSKRRLPVLWKFIDKEIGEIKINSVSKNTKACVKIGTQRVHVSAKKLDSILITYYKYNNK